MTSRLITSQAGFASGRNAKAYQKEGLEDVAALVGGDTKADAEKEKEAAAAAAALPPMPGSEDDAVPHVEWWDVQYLPKEKRVANNPKAGGGLKVAINTGPSAASDATYGDASLENSRYHKLVIHPVPVKPLGADKVKVPELPVYLTKKEAKRIRRQTRKEREEERKDKIALGLMEAPEPKLKLGNFMKVLGDQAISDPSKIEAKVMEQVQARVMNHEMRNAARKLTPAERKEKKRKKLAEDTSLQVVVGLYRVQDLSDTQHQFKVDMNAQQNNLTGGVLTCKGEGGSGDKPVSLVVVEGGPKAIKRYTRLMLRRIKWAGDEFDEDSDESDDEGTSGSKANSDNKCELVWTGTVVRRSFNAFRFQECNSSAKARTVMDSKGVAHYWDMVVRGDVCDPTHLLA